MQFMQIIEIMTDRLEELLRLEDEWRVAGRGRRTGIADWLCADRDTPGRYFSLNLFRSHDDAVANGELPETGVMAQQAMQIGSAAFHDCDVLHSLWGDELDAWAQKLAEFYVTTELPADLFTDDVVVELNFPHSHETFEGIDEVQGGLARAFGPGSIEEQRVVPTIGGFVLELALRGTGHSRQVCVAGVRGGLIAHLSIYSTGDLA